MRCRKRPAYILFSHRKTRSYAREKEHFCTDMLDAIVQATCTIFWFTVSILSIQLDAIQLLLGLATGFSRLPVTQPGKMHKSASPDALDGSDSETPCATANYPYSSTIERENPKPFCIDKGNKPITTSSEPSPLNATADNTLPSTIEQDESGSFPMKKGKGPVALPSDQSSAHATYWRDDELDPFWSSHTSQDTLLEHQSFKLQPCERQLSLITAMRCRNKDLTGPTSIHYEMPASNVDVFRSNILRPGSSSLDLERNRPPPRSLGTTAFLPPATTAKTGIDDALPGHLHRSSIRYKLGTVKSQSSSLHELPKPDVEVKCEVEIIQAASPNSSSFAIVKPKAHHGNSDLRPRQRSAKDLAREIILRELRLRDEPSPLMCEIWERHRQFADSYKYPPLKWLGTPSKAPKENKGTFKYSRYTWYAASVFYPYSNHKEPVQALRDCRNAISLDWHGRTKKGKPGLEVLPDQFKQVSKPDDQEHRVLYLG